MFLEPYLVLDLSDERGQLAGQMLAQLGAEVVAVEPPAGTRSRRLAPLTDAGESAVHLAYNRGKKSVVLDIEGSNHADIEAFRHLVEAADVVIESADRPHDLCTYEALSAINPSVVVASITAFGRTGPKAGWAATDLTAWAAGAPLMITGDDDRAPVRVGVPQAFAHASAEAAGAIIAALIERRGSRLGQHLDVSAQQASAQATQSMILAAPNDATAVTRSSGGLKVGPVFLRLVWPCKDGHVSITFLFGTALGPFSRSLMEWICEEGACDEATRDLDWIAYGAELFVNPEAVVQYERVKQIIEDFCLTKTKAELLEAALRRRLLIAPIASVEDVLNFDQLAARNYWDVVDGCRYPGPFVKTSSVALPALSRAPALGSMAAQDILAARPKRPATASADSPAETQTPPTRALEGLKVLDLMWVMAGPAGSRVLADHGATVVRIESSTRIEVARTLLPFRNDGTDVDTSALYASLNAGKLGANVNLATEAGRSVIHDLIRWADVVLESFSPKAMRGWGLDYESVKAINPRVVMQSSCLFGQSGPLSEFAGFGTMAAALSGFFGVTGWSDRPPCGPYGAYTDYISPRFANAALFAAIDHQQRTGEGQYLDFAQAEGALHALAPAIVEHQLVAPVVERLGNADRNLHPHGVFRCAGDDRWIAISCETELQRAALTALVGNVENEDAISLWTATLEPETATEVLQSHGIAAHTVQTSRDCVADAQLAARGHFVKLPHPSVGDMTIEGPRVLFSRTPARADFLGPTLGQHTYEVLTEILGYDDARFGELLVSGALD